MIPLGIWLAAFWLGIVIFPPFAFGLFLATLVVVAFTGETTRG